MEIRDYRDFANKNESTFRQIVARLAPRNRFDKLDSPFQIYEKFSTGERDGEFTICDFRMGKQEGEVVLRVQNATPGSGVVKDIIYTVKGNQLNVVSSSPVR
jgi:hypothetical protein